MHNSKLIDILRVFDRQEKEALKKWVLSPAHNHHEESKKLMLYILKKRKYTPRTVNRRQAYSHLFPKEDYKDSKLKHIMSYSVLLVEEFIEFLMHKKNTVISKKGLIEFYLAHDLNKYATQQAKKVRKTREKEQIKTGAHFYEQYLLEKLFFEELKTETRVRKTNLQSVVDNHYLAFVLNSLSCACDSLTHQRLYKSEYSIPLLEAVLEDVKLGKFDSYPAVQLYYNSYMALRYPKEEHYFQRLRKLLDKHYAVLSHREIKSIYLSAINYCVQKLNSGAEHYVQIVFELYQYGLTHAILIENGRLSRFTHKNIVTSGIRLKEYAWVNQFIADYTPFLEEKYQDNYKQYAQAKLFYAQAKFEDCLSLLTQVDFDDLFLNMSAKAMLLKIYYELAYFDSLTAFITSFRRFLQRKSILSYQREIYRNMINLTEKLIDLPYNDKQKQEELRVEIEQTNPLTEKPWLLAQLETLKHF